MSTSKLVNPDDPTVFPRLTEEELVQPVPSCMSITDEEFNAFLLTNIQPSSNPDHMASGNLTPKEFILECGLDPADFKSLQTPAPSGDSETWNLVMHEMLDKMTEWAKLTNISLQEMGFSVENLQNFGLLDDAQLSI
ncbi:hypothetical protein C0995_005245 [Termitomyces sp. Mi166|nr:hypothetical protein C0995_005245 [Termitomyces sp. Mi166\